MDIRIIYEDENVLIVEKPAGIIVFSEKDEREKTLIDFLLEKFPFLKKAGLPPRYGMVHRLDKETSGILLVAKDSKSLEFLQKKFRERNVLKKYLALVVGDLKPDQGKIETLIGRSPRDGKKQKIFSFTDPEAKRQGVRNAVTEYRVLARLHRSVAKAMERRRQGFGLRPTKSPSADEVGGQEKFFTFVEAIPKTGRKHQLRCHFSYLGHPIAGDRLYGFKKQPTPEKLNRYFLHATYLSIELPDGKIREFNSYLPEDLKEVLEQLKLESKK